MTQPAGYWGPATSSVDWCEENYTHSYYIAEFWNTISSLAMVALGFLGVALHHKSLGWRLSASYLLIVVVGIGSVLFHATLQFEHQMWDEVPMVWCACQLLWVLLDEHGYQGIGYTIGISIYCAFATYITIMWTDLYFVYQLYKNVKNEQVTRLFHQGCKFLIFALGVWLFDSNLCFVFDYVPNPQFHAWWHILMCTSLHYFFVACGHESVVRTGEQAEIKYFLNMIPHVQKNKKKEA
ncbi:hypothetical protein INT46_005210 [Mucor plumbeus]|uniref:Alkaline phytoceramidase n=1 Tax=Mucor plumbeus TaxID=97098 RepID=A0A8H7UST1_9FUNG|nr:hypothetical protein INT46_005210 [Mucor plumbeus]